MPPFAWRANLGFGHDLKLDCRLYWRAADEFVGHAIEAGADADVRRSVSSVH